MKIIHLALGNWYVDNYNYQENELPRQNLKDGNDVYIVASTEIITSKGQLEYVQACTYYNEDGIKVTRLPYRKIINKFITRKVRAYCGLLKILNEYKPDIIFFHDSASLAIVSAAKYKRKHPNVKLLVDAHSDYHNSAQNFLSKYILHKIIYRIFYQISKKQIDKYFYITYETMKFISEMYGVHPSQMYYFPLGGTIENQNIANVTQQKLRRELGFSESDIILLHSGKMSKEKRTLELLEAFCEITNPRFRLIVIGKFAENIYPLANVYIQKDARIKYLGWKDAISLRKYLHITDLYIQPGTQSITMQNAVCAGCAVAVYPYSSHFYLLGKSAFYIKTFEDIKKLLILISEDESVLIQKKKEAWEIATKVFDYKLLAQQMYY